MANNYLVHRIVGLDDDKQKYGIPELKKYPMPDAAHVRSAIRFFNYVEPAHEKELAAAILKRMKEYGLTFEDFIVGEENRFSKYVPESALKHYGIKGMKWGFRRFQNADGSLTDAGRARYSTGKVGFRRAPKPKMKIYSHEGKRAARKIKKDQGNTPLQEIIKSEKQRIGLAFLSAFLNTFVGSDGSLIGRDQYNIGFKATKQLTDADDIWGGLTAMELDLKELTHYGIKGMKWGIRRYQNPDGTLTEAGKRHYRRQDDRWVKRKADSIEERAYKKSQRELKKVTKKLDKKYSIKNAYERQGRRYMNEYNQNLSRIMNTKVDKLRSPSGRLVKFVAKRGEYGVHMALADPDYDMNNVRQGVWDSGRVAYRKNTLDKR